MTNERSVQPTWASNKNQLSGFEFNHQIAIQARNGREESKRSREKSKIGLDSVDVDCSRGCLRIDSIHTVVSVLRRVPVRLATLKTDFSFSFDRCWVTMVDGFGDGENGFSAGSIRTRRPCGCLSKGKEHGGTSQSKILHSIPLGRFVRSAAVWLFFRSQTAKLYIKPNWQFCSCAHFRLLSSVMCIVSNINVKEKEATCIGLVLDSYFYRLFLTMLLLFLSSLVLLPLVSWRGSMFVWQFLAMRSETVYFIIQKYSLWAETTECNCNGFSQIAFVSLRSGYLEQRNSVVLKIEQDRAKKRRRRDEEGQMHSTKLDSTFQMSFVICFGL